MNIRAAFLFFAFAFAAFPTQAQNPGGGPPAGAGQPTQSLAAQVALLQAQVALVTARIDKLEGHITAADLVGTYAIHGIQNEMHAPNSPGGFPTQISSYVFVGTAVLASDNSVSISGTQTGSTWFLGPPSSVQPFQGSGGPLAGTWTYANGAVTVSLGGAPVSLSVTAGGRVLIVASANPADNTDVLLILTRLH